MRHGVQFLKKSAQCIPWFTNLWLMKIANVSFFCVTVKREIESTWGNEFLYSKVTKWYLIFIFTVNSAPESECNLYGHIHINASASVGYLASTTAFSSRPGTLGCPWLLEVEPYQLINITLIDFSDRAMTSHTLFGDSGPPLGKCNYITSIVHATYK